MSFSLVGPTKKVNENKKYHVFFFFFFFLKRKLYNIKTSKDTAEDKDHVFSGTRNGLRNFLKLHGIIAKDPDLKRGEDLVL